LSGPRASSSRPSPRRTPTKWRSISRWCRV
jgi:hypothetical protein